MSIKTNTPSAAVFDAAIAALDNSGLQEFATILRSPEAATSNQHLAAVASDINIRIGRIEGNHEAASNALSALVRAVYL